MRALPLSAGVTQLLGGNRKLLAEHLTRHKGTADSLHSQVGPQAGDGKTGIAALAGFWAELSAELGSSESRSLGWRPEDAKRVWALGPRRCGPNMVR